MAKSFYSWLLQFKNDYTAIGDLARDVNRDSEFPRRSISYRYLKKYFESKHACLEIPLCTMRKSMLLTVLSLRSVGQVNSITQFCKRNLARNELAKVRRKYIQWVIDG